MKCKIFNLSQIYLIALALFAFNIASTEPGRTKRIAGRNIPAKPGQIPHIVFLYWFWSIKPIRQMTRFKCTANLLSPNFVVTAAHCYYHLLFTYRNQSSTYDFIRNLTKIQGHTYTRAGSTDGFVRDRGWQDRQGHTVYIPGAYTRPSTMFDMDVALVYIPIAFILNIPHISHVALAQISGVPDADDFRDCLAAGYGLTNAKQMQLSIRPDYKYGTMGVTKNKLHLYKVKFALNGYCRYLQKQLDGKLLYFDEFYGCARSSGTTRNDTYAQSCFGDGGGPVICDGLLTAIMVQRRENVPCDYFSGDRAFTLCTLLGAPDVHAWMKRHVKNLSMPVPLPTWDPWGVAGSTLDDVRLRDEERQDAGVEEESVRVVNGSDTGRMDDDIQVVGKGTKNEAGDLSFEGRTEDKVQNMSVGKVMEDNVGNVNYDKGLIDNVGTDGTKSKAVNFTESADDKVTNVGEVREDNDKKLENKTAANVSLLGKDDVKMYNIATEDDNSNATLHSRRSIAETISTGQENRKPELSRSQESYRSSPRSRRGGKPSRLAENIDGKKTDEKKTRREQVRRNADGDIVDGDIKEDDPDLVTLLTLIRGGGVNVETNRRKREQARLGLREEMAKELLRATRDLDPGALNRLGMGADVLTRDDIGEDPWAMEVWNDVFEDDTVQ